MATKTTGEVIAQLKLKARKEQDHIFILNEFIKHLEKCNDKVINKNVTQFKNKVVSCYIYPDYASLNICGSILNKEGYMDIRIYNYNMDSFSYIPEGKRKAVLNAPKLIDVIKSEIEIKENNIKEYNSLNYTVINDLYKKYNDSYKSICDLYQENKHLWNLCEIPTSLNVFGYYPLKMDIEGYKPLTSRERLSDEWNQYLSYNLKNRKELKNKILKILKDSQCWVGFHTLELINAYGYIFAGDENLLSVYPLCIDAYNVIPSINISINRGIYVKFLCMV